jgi:hypothetical protein
VASLIQSANDRSTVLRQLLDRPSLDAATYQRVAMAAKSINSDNDKANVLIRLSPHYTEAPFFDAVKTINSDNDRKRVLKSVIESTPAKATLLEIVDGATGINSDNEKAELLIAVAKASADAEVRSAVQRACGKIRSDGDYRRVASVLFNTTTE